MTSTLGAGMSSSGLMSIPNLLAERASTLPAEVAVEVHASGRKSSLTYEELERVSRATARSLASAGVLPGARVALVSDTSLQYVILLYAIAQLGAVAAPLNPSWTPRELNEAITRVRPSLVLVDQQQEERLSGRLSADIANVVDVVALEEDANVPRGALPDDPRNLYQILFTSGTTSRPKGVMLSQTNCLHGAIQAGATVGWSMGERFASALPLFHVNAQTFCLWSALVWGGTAILFDRFSARDHPKQLDQVQATVTSLVSTQVRTIVLQRTHLGARPRWLKKIVFAINVSDEERQALESAWCVSLQNGYGLSEAMTLVTIEPEWQPSRLWPSVGFPAVGRRIRLTNERGLDVEPGEVGELLVAGEPGTDLMLGYWDDTEATSRAFVNGWLHTGDLMRSGRWGELFYVGRTKDVIKVAGENVSAAEVETAILSHPQIAECAVISLPDPVRDEQVVAVVVARGSLDVALLQRYLTQRLAPFKLPGAVHVVETLPRSEIGKVDKRSIRQSLLASEDS